MPLQRPLEYCRRHKDYADYAMALFDTAEKAVQDQSGAAIASSIEKESTGRGTSFTEDDRTGIAATKALGEEERAGEIETAINENFQQLHFSPAVTNVFLRYAVLASHPTSTLLQRKIHTLQQKIRRAKKETPTVTELRTALGTLQTDQAIINAKYARIQPRLYEAFVLKLGREAMPTEQDEQILFSTGEAIYKQRRAELLRPRGFFKRTMAQLAFTFNPKKHFGWEEHLKNAVIATTLVVVTLGILAACAFGIGAAIVGVTAATAFTVSALSAAGGAVGMAAVPAAGQAAVIAAAPIAAVGVLGTIAQGLRSAGQALGKLFSRKPSATTMDWATRRHTPNNTSAARVTFNPAAGHGSTKDITNGLHKGQRGARAARAASTASGYESGASSATAGSVPLAVETAPAGAFHLPGHVRADDGEEKQNEERAVTPTGGSPGQNGPTHRK